MRLIMILLAALSFQATAQVYKWVDENGVTHFGNQPPPGEQEQVETRPGYQPSGDTARTQSHIIRQARELERKKRQEAADRRYEQAMAELDEEEDPENSWDCEYAREQVEEYEIQLRELGRKGYRQSEKDRLESWLREAERDVERDCN